MRVPTASYPPGDCASERSTIGLARSRITNGVVLAAYERVKLPGDFHERALRELRIGHVNGLARILEDVRHRHPELAADCERLGRLLGRFDLSGLGRALAEAEHE